MKSDNITDIELMDFCKWYKGRFGKVEALESVFITCLCGRFHTYPKDAQRLVNRMLNLNVISVVKGKVSI